MPTIAEQLTQLESDRSDLVDNLETMGITGLSGDETFTELVPEVLNIQGGADLSDYFNSTVSGGSQASASDVMKKIPDNLTVSGTDLQNVFKNYKGTTAPILDTSNVTNFYAMFQGAPNLTTIPQYNTSSGTNFGTMFRECYSLTSIPQIDTSNGTTFANMFNSCSSLVDVPVLNIPKATYNSTVSSMFYGCSSLSNQSLDNILQMCINATSFAGTKKLTSLGISSSYYSASTIEALPHYQDFLDAGWTIGF